MTQRIVDAPAKINLGLEILGKRPDGFHEIRTILCKIALSDTLIFDQSDDDTDRVSFAPVSLAIDDDHNLVVRALRAMRRAGAEIPPQRIAVIKRIPAAAGLGGASSDAASTLLAFAPEMQEAGADQFALAADLGSDIPFFLGSQVAHATGRGERLQPLPALNGEHWGVLATPNLTIPEKTKTMYGAVDSSWWSTGDAVQSIADQLPNVPETAPPNVFERALLRLYPELSGFRHEMIEAGCPYVALTGAGPTFYTLVESEMLATAISGRLQDSGSSCVVAKLGTSPSGQ